MGKLLFLVGSYLLKGSVKTALAGAGLGLASAVVMKTVLERYINQALQQMQGFDAVVASFLHLSGFDVALSVVIGALIARVTMNSMKLSLVKKGAS